jgi:thioredoxin-dependent peroxiredoxin
MTELSVGDRAADLSLPTGDGQTVRLADMRGKRVVLYFYPKDNTEGCTAEAIDFSALRSQFEAAGTVVVGVSPDSLRSHAKFTSKHALSVTLGSDENLEAANAFGVWVEKSMYGRKFMGVERATFLMDSDGIIQRTSSESGARCVFAAMHKKFSPPFRL